MAKKIRIPFGNDLPISFKLAAKNLDGTITPIRTSDVQNLVVRYGSTTPAHATQIDYTSDENFIYVFLDSTILKRGATYSFYISGYRNGLDFSLNFINVIEVVTDNDDANYLDFVIDMAQVEYGGFFIGLKNYDETIRQYIEDAERATENANESASNANRAAENANAATNAANAATQAASHGASNANSKATLANTAAQAAISSAQAAQAAKTEADAATISAQNAAAHAEEAASIIESKIGDLQSEITELESEVNGQRFFIEHGKRFLANGYYENLPAFACTTKLELNGTYTFPKTNSVDISYRLFKYISDTEGQEVTSGYTMDINTFDLNGTFIVTFNNGSVPITSEQYSFLENDYKIDGLKKGLVIAVEELYGEVDKNSGNIEQINSDITEIVDEYVVVDLEVKNNKEFNFGTLTIDDNTNFQCAIVNVAEGEQYFVSGYNQNSNLPLAVVWNSTTNAKERLLNIGTNKVGTDIQAIIPNGYDRMAINGHKSAPVALKKYTHTTKKLKDIVIEQEITKASFPLFVAITDMTNGKVISINKRFSDAKDVVWKFGNKPSNANNNFDFKELGFVTRGEDAVSDKFLAEDGYEYLIGHNTDYILAIQCGADNNANGDFPTNKTLFTGGFHGYNNVSDKTASATMREISKHVYADGKELTSDGRSAYCNTCKIVVVNRIQGCNTEKQDGTGREIVEQKIIVDFDANNVFVTLEFKALESITFYGLSGLAQYFDFDKFRFIGSHSKMAEYTKGELVRVSNDDKGTVAIRNYGNDYAFEVGIDKTFGVGDSHFNKFAPNAEATTAKKGYFELVSSSSPLTLNEGDMITMRGYYSFNIVE